MDSEILGRFIAGVTDILKTSEVVAVWKEKVSVFEEMGYLAMIENQI